MGDAGLGLFAEPSASNQIDGAVASGPHQPGGRDVGDTVERPRPQGAEHGLLDHVGGQVDLGGPEDTDPPGGQLSREGAEQPIDEMSDLAFPGRGQGVVSTRRTSIQP